MWWCRWVALSLVCSTRHTCMPGFMRLQRFIVELRRSSLHAEGMTAVIPPLDDAINCRALHVKCKGTRCVCWHHRVLARASDTAPRHMVYGEFKSSTNPLTEVGSSTHGAQQL